MSKKTSFPETSAIKPRSFEVLAAFESLGCRLFSLSCSSDTPRARPAVVPLIRIAPVSRPTDFYDPRLGHSTKPYESAKPSGQTKLAGDNPAGRTRGFHFKIIPQSSASRDTTFSTYQSQPMASFTASMTGPSHPQGVAGTTASAATYLQAVASSAISDAGTHRLGANVPAASGLHALGTLLRTPVTQRNARSPWKLRPPQRHRWQRLSTSGVLFIPSSSIPSFFRLDSRPFTSLQRLRPYGRLGLTSECKSCARPSGSPLGGIRSLERRPLARQHPRPSSDAPRSDAC